VRTQDLPLIVWLFSGAALLLGLPLLGVWLAGHDPQAYAEFPPLTHYVEHAAFCWFAFGLMAVGILAVMLPFVIHAGRHWRTAPAALPATTRFPWWGWCAVAVGLFAWMLAWTRFAWFAPWQAFTFSPLWLAFIVTVNALTYRRTGHCALLDRPAFFTMLFPASALFWWFFEYLNRFVQNWVYEGVEAFSATDYVLFATLPFATVLPAVYGVTEWLQTYPRLTAGLDRFVVLRTGHPKIWALAVLLLAAGGLAGIGIWSDYLFPLLWVSPLLLIVCIQALRGRTTIFAPLQHGDWREICRWALAALICGFFWEMWNWHSLARWVYNVPFVGRFPLFEMPVLGYAGYLPFGLQCAVVTLAVDRWCKQPPGASVQAWLPAALALAALLLSGHLAPALFLHLLGLPSAWLASLWLGAPLSVAPGCYWIPDPQQAIQVTTSCNASGFFALLMALTVPCILQKVRKMRAFGHASLLFAAPFAVAIVANSVRIITAWYAARATTLLDIPAWHGTIHYVSGLLVFFVFLVGYHIIMERIQHDPSKA